MSRSVENERTRLVTVLFLASLAQDFFLFWANLFAGLANATNGVNSLFKAVSQGFLNFANTFRHLWADQDQKYEVLTGRSFGFQPTVEVEDEDEAEVEDD